MSVPARFFDGRRAVPHAVALALSDGTLHIRALDGSLSVDWPVQAIAVRDGPDPDGAALLARGHDPARLLVADAALLGQLANAVRGRHRRTLRRRQRHWGLALAGAIAGLAVCALAVDQAPALLSPFVPLAWENRLGDGVERALVASAGRCVSADGQRVLDRLVGQLASANGLDRPPSVAVINDGTVNALTLPGQRILVLRGLIAAAEDGDELAGVIAHEMGHVAHRDPLKALLRAVGLNLVTASLGVGGGGSVNTASLAQNAAGAAYGRAAETAADAAAIDGLRRAGLRADGLGRFFAVLQRREAGGGAYLAWLADHPPTAARAERVAQDAEGAPAMTEAEWVAVRSMCRGG